MAKVRSETNADHAAIRSVNVRAFGRPNEGALVDQLRREATPFISLVAELDDRIVGHISFSPVSIDGLSSPGQPMGLGPVAVLPELQRQGIGTQLVREGLEYCRRGGHGMVVVVGHPSYYPRFGFTPAKDHGLRCEYPVPDNVFMVIELVAGALDQERGLVRYHPAFSQV